MAYDTSEREARRDAGTSGSTLEHEPEVVRPRLDENTALVDTTVHRAHRRLLRRLFPRPEDRQVAEHRLSELEIGFDFRQRALKMAVETKLQAVEELCNHVLVTGKSELRRRRQEFFADQRLRLQTAMDDIAERFHERVDEQLARLPSIADERLREREERRLLAGVDQFHDMLDELARDFMEIIKDSVSRRD